MKRGTFTFFVAPSVFIMLALMTLPLLASIWLGLNFITFRNLDEPIWVGLQNYQEVLADPEFWDSLEFTLIFIAVAVPARILLGLLFALLLDQITRFRGLFIAAALVPFVMTPVVGTLIFRDMFDRGGPYWYWIQQLFDYRLFMNSTTVPLLIIFHSIWTATPFAMIVLFAGLQTLPQESLEAARVDGASWFRQLWHVAIPHLRSLFVFIGLDLDHGFLSRLRQRLRIDAAEPDIRCGDDHVLQLSSRAQLRSLRQSQRHERAHRARHLRRPDSIPRHDLSRADGGRLMTRTDNPFARTIIYIALALFTVYNVLPFSLDDSELDQAAQGRQRQDTALRIFSPTGENYSELWLNMSPQDFAPYGLLLLILVFFILVVIALFRQSHPGAQFSRVPRLAFSPVSSLRWRCRISSTPPNSTTI